MKNIPAFPHQKEDGSPYWGMDLRDYFAAEALKPFMAWSLNEPISDEIDHRDKAAAHYAKVAYKIADAMLAARKVKE